LIAEATFSIATTERTARVLLEDPHARVAMRRRIAAQDGVEELRRIEAIYLGPGQVLVAAEVRLDPRLDAAGVARTLTAARARIAHDVQAVARLYLTPVE
jgi:hypothetical protein